jgi:NAD-dependent deacetylase
MPAIPIDDKTWVLVLTGAGVSAESGIPTFRDANGLWENHAVEQVASPQGFRDDPVLVWRFYSQRRAAAKACAPNPGHQALVTLEQRLGERFLLATQNVDNLHRRAGTQRLVELHGNLFMTRCSSCSRPPFEDLEEYTDKKVPGCGRCHEAGRDALLRPHIVWFGEMLEPRHLRQVAEFIEQAGHAARSGGRFVFLAAGTSGVVFPAARMVDDARARGAESWLVNAEPADNTAHFHHFVQGPSGKLLPELFGLS